VRKKDSRALANIAKHWPTRSIPDQQEIRASHSEREAATIGLILAALRAGTYAAYTHREQDKRQNDTRVSLEMP
jgi:hypothetical protein